MSKEFVLFGRRVVVELNGAWSRLVVGVAVTKQEAPGVALQFFAGPVEFIFDICERQ